MLMKWFLTKKVSAYSAMLLLLACTIVSSDIQAKQINTNDDQQASIDLNQAFAATDEAFKASISTSEHNHQNLLKPTQLSFEAQKQIELVTAYIVRNLFTFSCEVEKKGCDQLVEAQEKVQSIERLAQNFQSQGFSLNDKDYELLAALNGYSNSLQARIDDIYIGPLKVNVCEDFAIHNLIPFSFGQQYIGKISAKDYEMAWQQYIKKINANNKPNSPQNCYLSAAGTNLSVFGSNCLPFDGFDRIEAHSDDKGTLVAVSIIAKLKGNMSVDTFLKFLDSRYLAISPQKHDLKELADLNDDLTSLMCQLSNGNYVSDIYWYNYDKDKYVRASFSAYNDNNIVTLLFAQYDYFVNQEKLNTLRRLAILRQELEHYYNIEQGKSNKNLDEANKLPQKAHPHYHYPQK